jgi:hypothetical protein
MPHFNHFIAVYTYSFIFLIRAHIVEMAAAEVNDLGQRGGRESEQVAAAQVSGIPVHVSSCQSITRTGCSYLRPLLLNRC